MKPKKLLIQIGTMLLKIAALILAAFLLYKVAGLMYTYGFRIFAEEAVDRKPGIDEKKYFIAAKMYVDFLWTLWGLTRVPFDGDFMQEYADGRYIRLKKNIEAYKKLG